MTMSAPSPSDPLGYDGALVFTDDGLDLDETGRDATGIELVDAAIIMRLTTDTLCMIDAPGDAIEFGEDVRRWVNEVTTEGAAKAKGPRLAIVLQRDERILNPTVIVSLAPDTATMPDGSRVSLKIDITYTTVTGATLRRVVGVSAVDVAFLAQGT